MQEIRITNITVTDQKCALKTPYVLSFGTISFINSIQTEITFSNGAVKRTEAVPLPGYSDETAESILGYLNNVSNDLIGREVKMARELIKKDIPNNPFAASPILTAIDLLEYKIETPEENKMEFVIPVSSGEPKKLSQFLKSLPANKFTTVKVKLTGELDTDVECISHINSCQAKNVQFRLDANKAFNYQDARSFYSELTKIKNNKNVAYVEQPMTNNAWEEHEAIVKEFNQIRTMLDESIVTEEDLEKAIKIKIPFVKFKLFKQGGIKELLRQMEIAFNNNIEVVLGNGVATRLSNDIENSVYYSYKERIFGASEANGFLKLS